jgi:nitroreductase
MTRRSVRTFADKEIKKEELEQIITAATYAPSAMNTQSWHFTVLLNKEKMQKLAKLIAKNLDMKGDYNFYRPEALILVSDDKDNVNSTANCACALQNIFLMSHELGIGSVWINQLRTLCEVPEVRAMISELGVPGNHNVYGMAALGYPSNRCVLFK